MKKNPQWQPYCRRVNFSKCRGPFNFIPFYLFRPLSLNGLHSGRSHKILAVWKDPYVENVLDSLDRNTKLPLIMGVQPLLALP